MTKKILLMMTAVMMMTALAACGRKNSGGSTGAPEIATEAPAGAETEAPTEAETGAPAGNGENGDLTALIGQLYEKAPSLKGLTVGEPMAVDLSTDDCAYWIGIGAAGVESAWVSEPMMSSVAHSLCLIRAEDGADVEQMKEDILNGVDPGKWICVFAEKTAVINSGNVILLVMSRAEAVEEICTAFSELMNGNTGEKLERGGE